MELPREDERQHLVVLLPLPHDVLEPAAVAGDVRRHLVDFLRVPAEDPTKTFDGRQPDKEKSKEKKTARACHLPYSKSINAAETSQK